MTQRLSAASLAVLVFLAAVGCGKGNSAADKSPSSTADSLGSAQADTAGESAPRYKSVDDPNAVYTLADITMFGSYLKLDLDDIPTPVMNRIIHRLRTEECTCGCPDTIDECLIVDPQCTTAVTLANQIIREEKIKG